MYLYKLFIEAFVIGLMTTLFGCIIFYTCSILREIKYDYKIISINLFLTGVFIHLFCEFANINKWYLTNSAAYLKK